jgi:hypothetical protein
MSAHCQIDTTEELLFEHPRAYLILDFQSAEILSQISPSASQAANANSSADELFK